MKDQTTTQQLTPLFTIIQCVNCSGYGTKGFAKLICPTCKGEGVVKVEAKEEKE